MNEYHWQECFTNIIQTFDMYAPFSLNQSLYIISVIVFSNKTGLLIYFCYGVHFSVQKKRNQSSKHPVSFETIDVKMEDKKKMGSTTPTLQTKF